jgi:hypothetical protein
MTTPTSKRRDFTQIAFDVMRRATGELAPEPALTGKKADSQKGGLKGGTARAKKLTAEERSEIAKKAAEARWKK